MEDLKARTPEYRLRSEKETEELLHKYKVIARKQQIEQMKLESDIPYYPFSISTYMHPASRFRVFKIIWETLKLKLLDLRP